MIIPVCDMPIVDVFTVTVCILTSTSLCNQNEQWERTAYKLAGAVCT